MPGIKISALPAVPSAQLTDIFPVVQGGITYKETVTQLSTLLGSTFGITPTSNNSVFTTNNTGVAGWRTALPLNTGISFSDGGIIKDNNGNTLISFTVAPSAVNFLNIRNNSTGGTVNLTATGSDTNVSLRLNGKGTGSAILQGTGTNDNAGVGFVGEFQSSIILGASAISMTNDVIVDLTSISLTAGDWDVWGNLLFTIGGTCTRICGWISDVSVTQPDSSFFSQIQTTTSIGGAGGVGVAFCVPQRRFSLASTTTIYISGISEFSTSTLTLSGAIYARRVR